MAENSNDEIQDVKIQGLREFFNEKFKNIEDKVTSSETNIIKEVTRTDGKVTLMEEKNCRKHQEILETTNKYRGELQLKLEELKKEMKECYITKEEVKGVMNFYNKLTDNWIVILFFLLGVIAVGLFVLIEYTKK